MIVQRCVLTYEISWLSKIPCWTCDIENDLLFSKQRPGQREVIKVLWPPTGKLHSAPRYLEPSRACAGAAALLYNLAHVHSAQAAHAEGQFSDEGVAIA